MRAPRLGPEEQAPCAAVDVDLRMTGTFPVVLRRAFLAKSLTH